jgi:hypothetical protein
VIVRISGREYAGRTVDLPSGVACAARLGAAVRGEPVDVATVECAEPGPAHEHVGVVEHEASVRVRAALAAAARSQGRSAPQDAELAAVRDRLATLPTPAVDRAAARRRAAEAAARERSLRERVATLRGRVRAVRAGESGPQIEGRPDSVRADGGSADAGDLGPAAEALAEAASRLAAAETERIAAEEVLDRERAARDARDRRLRLEDRAANRERAARRHLVDAVREEFREAVAATPGEAIATTPGSACAAEPEDIDPVTATLAVARVATLDAPVVLGCQRFETARSAADWLDAAVVRLDGERE